MDNVRRFARIVWSRRATGILGIVLLVIFGSSAWYFIYQRDSGPRLSRETKVRASEPSRSLPILVLLEPGTVVDAEPPPGWTHTVVKSVTFISGGDIATLPAFAIKSATLFRTMVLADVERDPGSGQFYLSRVGAGLGTPHQGKDTIISYDSLGSMGVELSTLDGLVLNRAEKALGRSRLGARTPTFALYDTFVELADESGTHQPIILRYALMVDPATGSLRSAVWPMAEHPEARTPVETLSLLPDGYIFSCGIHVAARRIFGNLASSWRFAMMQMPTGESVPMTESLQSLANKDPEDLDAKALESAVRETLGDRSPPRVPVPSPLP